MILISVKISTGNREGLTLYRNIIYKTLWNNNKHLIIYSENYPSLQGWKVG